MDVLRFRQVIGIELRQERTGHVTWTVDGCENVRGIYVCPQAHLGYTVCGCAGHLEGLRVEGGSEASRDFSLRRRRVSATAAAAGQHM